ncbi:hypothetical protein Pcac1_g13867 [Phytophthora cactorum]|nr:hypothetical protein Pcac1_g13867 [Phytophthora cactorum]KAG3196770.1 hypothetical protein PC128_g7376 [Phytophthora cactorum]
MTPSVLYKRIVPHLRKKWWQIARGRGLEEGDRIYRPGFKNKGKLAKRDDGFFSVRQRYFDAGVGLDAARTVIRG